MTDQPALGAVRLAARNQAGAIVRPIVGGELVLPAGVRRQASTMDVAAVLALLRRGNVVKAAGKLQKLVGADPLDPEPWCLRAMIDLQEQAYGAALANAGRALELDPSNPRTVVLAPILRFQAHYLTGDANAQALNLAPSNPGLLLLMVDWAHNAKRDEVSRRYLALAGRISPDFPAVRKFRRLLEVNP